MMRSVQARVLGGLAAWISGTVMATLLSLFAVSALGHGMSLGGVQTLSSDQAARALQAGEASASAAPTAGGPGGTAPVPGPSGGAEPTTTPNTRTGPAPSGTARPAPTSSGGGASGGTLAGSTDSGTGTLLTSPGGSAIAVCRADGVYLSSWSPAQGYQAQGVVRGPAAWAAVRFVLGSSAVVLHARCVAGQPRSWVSSSWGDDGGTSGDR